MIQESLNHLFLLCPYFKGVWKYVMKTFIFAGIWLGEELMEVCIQWTH